MLQQTSVPTPVTCDQNELSVPVSQTKNFCVTKGKNVSQITFLGEKLNFYILFHIESVPNSCVTSDGTLFSVPIRGSVTRDWDI